MPANVRAVAVPPTVIPVPAFPVIVPDPTLSVTVQLDESTSAKGVPVKSKSLATSSVTVNDPGALIVGLSLTAVMLIVEDADALELPSETKVVKVLDVVLFAAGV